MTPEELRRMRMIEDIDTSSVSPSDTLSNEGMLSNRISGTQANRSKQAVVDTVTAVAPGLLALFGGASPTVTSGLMDKGNKYAMDRGALTAPSKKNIEVIKNEIGEPENIMDYDTIGMEPYQPIKMNSLGDKSGNVQSKMTFSNKKTGDLLSTYLARNGQMFRVGETPETAAPLDPEYIKNDYVPFFGFGTAKSSDMYGGSSSVQFQKTLPSKKVVVGGAQGYARTQNVPTEGLKVFEKSQDELNKIIVPIEQKRKSLNDAVTILGNESSTPSEMAAAQEAIIRGIINDPILTEGDIPRAMGDKYKSLFKQVIGAVGRKAVGEMNRSEREEMLKSARALSVMMESGISSMYNKFKGEVSTIPGASELAKKRNPQIEERRKSREAELIKIKEIAKKQFGNDKKSYDSYINIKKSQLGL